MPFYSQNVPDKTNNGMHASREENNSSKLERTDDIVDEDVLEEFMEESISGSVLLVPSFSSPRFGRGQCTRIVCLRSIVKTCKGG